MKKLTKKQFAQALRKGLGRALLHVQEFGIESVRDLVINAFCHDLRYDPQVEDSRAPWLREIVESASEASNFCDVIEAQLRTANNANDLAQLAYLAGEFIDAGFGSLTEILYSQFERSRETFKDCLIIGQPLIKVDGMKGLEFVFTLLAKRNEEDLVAAHILFDEACEIAGRAEVMAKLQAMETQLPWLQNFLRYLVEEEKRIEVLRSSARTKETPSLDEIIAMVEACEHKYGYQYTRYGQHATAEDITKIFARLIEEQHPGRILRYLYIFGKRELPEIHPKIFALTATGTRRARRAAFIALSHTKSAKVREFAIEQLTSNPRAVRDDLIGLFNRNYQSGDDQLILGSLETSKAPWITHSICLDVIKLCEQVSDPELAGCLIWVYEHSPCTNCREHAVKILTSSHRAPLSLLEECVWDCSTYNRELANAALGLQFSR